MRNITTAIIFLLSISSSLHAAQEIIVQPDAEVNCVMAKDELTRIKVYDDRIISIKSNAGELEILEDSNVGDIYLRPLTSKWQVNLFITTERGDTYKLRLAMSNKNKAEQVFLRKVDNTINPKSLSKQQEMLEIIKSLRAGKWLFGWTSVATKEAPRVKDYTMSMKQCYITTNLEITVYELTSKRSGMIVIDYEDLANKLKADVLSIDSRELNANQTTNLYVIKEIKHDN